MSVVARGAALQQLRSDGDTLAWRSRDQVVTAVVGGAPVVAVSGLPEIALALVAGVPVVASAALGIRRLRGGALEEIATFGHASKIQVYGGDELVAVVAVVSTDDEVPNRYDVHRFDAAGRSEVVSVVHDREPLIALAAGAVWIASYEVTARAAHRDVMPSGDPVRIERQQGHWVLRGPGVEVEIAAPRAHAASAAGVLMADTEQIVRVAPSGAIVPIADASYVDDLVSWREGAAWIESSTVWGVASPGAVPVELWSSEHALREIVAIRDQLAVIEDPEADPFATALGPSEALRSIVMLSR